MFYVYEWFIINTNEVIYVGKGCGRRYKVRKHNCFFNDMIERYQCDSRIVKTFVNEKEAFEYEHQRITELKKQGQCVCNIYNGGAGGTTSWWTDEKKQEYSMLNVMKSEAQRERMRTNNPMQNPKVAEKTNGQKRRTVTVGNIVYDSIEVAKKELNTTYCRLLTWAKHGRTPYGDVCMIEPQKQYRNKNNMHGNQQPSRGNVNNSTSEGSTTNG